MATVITAECINCGACEPECPNTAIYQGGVEWELNGVKHPAIAQDTFYIVRDKCTECVGFFEQEACAAVCPVECCVPDPEIPETEDALLARAKTLHPDKTFEVSAPSRFRKTGAATAPPETSPAPVIKVAAVPTESKPTPPAAAPVAPKPAAVPKPVTTEPKAAVSAEEPSSAVSGAAAPAPAAPPPAPVAAKTAAPTAAPAEKKATVEQPAATPPPKRKPGDSFPGELPGSFEEALAQLGRASSDLAPSRKARVWLLQPILGALSETRKKGMEEGIADHHCFTAVRATVLNVVLNLLGYPFIAAALGATTLSRFAFRHQWYGFLAFGFALAAVEAVIRLREGVLHGWPPERWRNRGSCYGWLLATLVAPFTHGLEPVSTHGTIAVDGFHGNGFADKLERERRYGQVYSLNQEGNGYLLHFEFARQVPPSAVKEQFGIADEMPDYDYELGLRNGSFVVQAHVVEKNLRRLAAVSPGFPPDFTTNVELPKPASAFKHRLRNKTLEVVLLR